MMKYFSSPIEAKLATAKTYCLIKMPNRRELEYERSDNKRRPKAI